MKHIKFSEQERQSILFVIKERFKEITQDEILQPKYLKNEFYYPLFQARQKLENNETYFLNKEVEIMKITLINIGVREKITDETGYITNRLKEPFASAYNKLKLEKNKL